MSFLVDDKQPERHAKIKSFLANSENAIAVLLAADFEWTVRRAILALGTSPNADICSKVLSRCSGLEKYKEAWTQEVKQQRGKCLKEVVPNWDEFKEAYKLRHTLVHGVTGTTGKNYAEVRISRILAASAAVCAYSLDQGVDLYSRLPIRQRKKTK
ncbi:MAG: hypothetical protein R3E40_05540 [Rhodocyclaceae bacterium]